MVNTSAGDTRDHRVRRDVVRSELDETKASLQTTEFWVFIAAVVGVLIATQQLDHMQGWDGWRLVSALTIGYMLSRGLAKAGSLHRDDRD